MDCDLQDSPEDIPLRYSRQLKPDPRCGMRRKRTWFIKRQSSRLFLWLFELFRDSIEIGVEIFGYFASPSQWVSLHAWSRMRFCPCLLRMDGNQSALYAPAHSVSMESSYTLWNSSSIAATHSPSLSNAPRSFAGVWSCDVASYPFVIDAVFWRGRLLFARGPLMGKVPVRNHSLQRKHQIAFECVSSAFTLARRSRTKGRHLHHH